MTDLVSTIFSDLAARPREAIVEQVEAATHGRMWVAGARVYLEAPYDPTRVEAVRRIPGRRWTGSRDEFPARPSPT